MNDITNIQMALGRKMVPIPGLGASCPRSTCTCLVCWLVGWFLFDLRLSHRALLWWKGTSILALSQLSNVILRSLLLLWEIAACCCTGLCPVCLGKACTHSISMEMCFGGLRGKEDTLKSVSDSQLLYLGATLAQAGPARFTLASLSLH